MQHVSRVAVRRVGWPLCDQIVPMIGEKFPNRFRRSAIDLQAGAVPEANAFIAAVHHDKANRPRPAGIDLRYLDPLAAPASVVATCFKNHFQFSILSVQKDVETAARVRPRPLRTY
jgi:hypothetical protein